MIPEKSGENRLWGRPTSAVDLIGCYFTVGGDTLRINISEDKMSQIDVGLAHINLKLYCSLQEPGQRRDRVGGGTESIKKLKTLYCL